MKDKIIDRMIGEKLKNYRLINDMTLEEVGDRIGYTKTGYRLFEIGERSIPIPVLIKVCKIYNVDYKDFLDDIAKKI